MDGFRENYRNFLAVPKSAIADNDPRVRALNRAHENRKLELEFYWQRSAYSWTLQAAAFAALALVFSNGRLATPTLLLPVTVFGAITAFAARLTATGSKFWQENWEYHVDLLEGDIEGQLAQTVIVRHRVGFSVSKVNERLLSFFLFGWMCAFLFVSARIVWPSLDRLPPPWDTRCPVLLSLSALLLGMGMLRWRTVTGLHGREWSDETLHEPRRGRRRHAMGRRWSWRELVGLRHPEDGAWLIQRDRN